MAEKRDEQKKFFAEWLEKLQQESWQLELLISGFALYGIWESKTWLYDINDYIVAQAVGEIETILKILIHALSVGWVIFFTNLLFHIILRGLWIGAIGLRYVSGDIQYDKLNYSPQFLDYLKRKVGDFDDYIERLEKISSVLFSYTFLLFFIFVSFFLLIVEFILVTGFFFSLIGDPEDNILAVIAISIFGILFLFFLFFVVVDFITLGGMRRIKEPTISKIYMFFYKIFSILTLSFLYRPLIYNFLDNKFTKRLFLLGIPYGILIAVVLPGFFFSSSSFYPILKDLTDSQTILGSRYAINPYYYDDLRSEENDRIKRKEEIKYVSLGSYEIEDDFAPIFLRFKRRDNKLFENLDLQTAAFSEIGLRHKLFRKNYLKSDHIRDSIRLENSKERLVMKKVIRKLELKEDEIDSNYIKAYQGLGVDTIKALSAEIDNRWNEKLSQRSFDRYEEIMNAMKAVHELSIDSLSVELQNCYFFNHQNLNEKGILCYIQVDSLVNGPHELIVNRKMYAKNKEGFSLKKLYIPFLKN